VLTVEKITDIFDTEKAEMSYNNVGFILIMRTNSFVRTLNHWSMSRLSVTVDTQMPQNITDDYLVCYN